VGFHNRGCVHRDLRWPNILKTKTDWIVIDFELSAAVGRKVIEMGGNTNFFFAETHFGQTPHCLQMCKQRLELMDILMICIKLDC
jgi:thiamine kinase-like enzyme